MVWETTKEFQSGEGVPRPDMAWETTKKCRSGEVGLVAAACDALHWSAFECAVLDILRIPLLLPVAKVNDRLGPSVST